MVNSILSSRGWIFQEQVVSSRQLHFVGQHQMYWMCEELFEAEDGTSLSSTVPPWFKWLYKQKAENTYGWPDRESIILANIEHNDWASLVANYTHRSLTKMEDKLRAISAMAKLFGYGFDDEYILGCWKKCLEFDLLWVSDLTHPIDERELIEAGFEYSIYYPIPTWSWLSADGPVEFPHLRDPSGEVQLHFRVLGGHICIYPQDNDTFGTIPFQYSPLRVRSVVETAFRLEKTYDQESQREQAPP
jgi:hypothetical protein